MEYVAKNTVRLGKDETYAPGDVVDIKDKKVAKSLLEAGAIEERRMTPSEAKRAAAEDDKDKE